MNEAYRVCWAMAQECRDDDVVIVGVATPLATAAAFVARETTAPGLSIVVGGAVDPPLIDVAELMRDPASASREARAMLGQRDMLSLMQGGTFTLQFISPAQVGRDGAINTSRVRTERGWRRLPGCLALPDTTVTVGRLVAYRVGGGHRFLVDEVDYVTGLGSSPDLRKQRQVAARGIVAVITDEGRHAMVDGVRGPAEPLPAVPPDVADLFTSRIDRHRVLEYRRSSERSISSDVK